VFNYANVGYLWNFDWLRFLQEESTDYGAPHVWVHLTGGGLEWYADPNSDGAYDAGWRSQATVVRTSASPLRYERRLPDGTVEVYAQPDNGPANRKRVFLTQIVDPQGQALTFTWDASFRLVAVTDAVGQVTTLCYNLGTDPLKLTKVTDPFGRFAVLTYTASGQLASVTDVVGITSSFTYETGDFIAMLTTPYGQTVFRHEDNWIYAVYNDRMVEATDPLGGTEHMEYHWYSSAIPATAPASEVPTDFAASNTTLGHYNTFYWDKRAWQLAPGDQTKAVVTKWLVKPAIVTGPHMAVDAPHSTKRPLEGRVWYSYPGQPTTSHLGSLMQPAKVGRTLENGTSQISEWTYDTFGNVLTATDPLGRRTSYTYAANGVDLLTVRQTTGSLNDLLASFSGYTAQHRPQTSVDAAGQTTTTTYNAAGQPLTITNPKLETTTLAYNANGQLTTMTGPVSGAQWTYTYDSYGRARTVTDPDGYTVTTDYDVFDRPTKATYPDATYDAFTYDRLDLVTRRDRLGRLTRYCSRSVASDRQEHVGGLRIASTGSLGPAPRGGHLPWPVGRTCVNGHVPGHGRCLARRAAIDWDAGSARPDGAAGLVHVWQPGETGRRDGADDDVGTGSPGAGHAGDPGGWGDGYALYLWHYWAPDDDDGPQGPSDDAHVSGRRSREQHDVHERRDRDAGRELHV
jgi:YD repeat-containing protein